MTVAKIIIAIVIEKSKKPNSEAHDFSVYPSIRRPKYKCVIIFSKNSTISSNRILPCECLENLKIRKTRKTRKVTKAPETSSFAGRNNPT